MNVKNIIIEGCDGTGKTTLCRLLARKYGWDTVHVTSKDPNDFDFYKQTLRKTNVVYDRHFLGELIYPKVYDRKGNLNVYDADWFRKYSLETKTCIIVLTTDIDEIKRRLTERGELSFVYDKVEIINKQFIGLANRLMIKIFDTSIDSFEDICKYIESCFEEKDFVQRGINEI